MKTRTLRSNEKLRKLTLSAIFTAVAYVVMLLVHITVGGFLTLDLKDAILAFGAMALGPVYGIGMVAVTAFLEFMTVSGTGWYGLLMNILSSAAFVGVSSLIYRYKRTLPGAIVGLVSAIFSVTAVMMIANTLVTPLYFEMPRMAVVKQIPTLLLPFNFAKALLNSGFVLILYKPITSVLRLAKLLPASASGEKYRFDKRTAVMLTVALVAILLSLAILFLFLKGSVGFGKELGTPI